MKQIKIFYLFFAILILVSTGYCVELEETTLQEIQIKSGDTLWSISNHYLKDPQAWPEVLKYNKLPSSDPNIILPGMIIKVPVILIKEQLRPAYMTYLLNNVQFKKKNSMEWNQALLNMQLFNEDNIRTMEKSRANLTFITGETVYIDENSLISVRPEKKREEIELFSGAIRASRSKVLTDSAEIVPRIEKLSPNPDFKTRVKADKTTFVEVYGGEVAVSAQGKTVTLTEGFGTQVKFMKPPSLPKALPPLPKIDIAQKPSWNHDLTKATTAAQDKSAVDAAIDYVQNTLKLELSLFNKEDSENKGKESAKVISDVEIKQYHLQIAFDNNFTKIAIDEIKPYEPKVELKLNKYELSDGMYFYHIAYINDLEFESKFTPTKRFILDTNVPRIEFIGLVDNQQTLEDFIHVEGTVNEPSILTVNDKTIFSDEKNSFSTALMLKFGKNEISVSAKDKANNIVKYNKNVYKVTKITQGPAKRSSYTFRWLSTPAGISVTITTFMVIVLVIGFLFTP